MKRFCYIFLLISLAISCKPAGENPYENVVEQITVSIRWPEGFEGYCRENVPVRAEDSNLGYVYTRYTDSEGTATFVLPRGLYRFSVNDRIDSHIFNAVLDRVIISPDTVSAEIILKHSKAGVLVIKEIYSGGCRKSPAEGTYQADQYVIIHNNGSDIQYLDSLCFGTMVPYNATATNPFLIKGEDGSVSLPDFVPIADAVWQFSGDGKTFPLKPGEDAVLCIRGAIDHAATYPLSVNLNREDYFVMYDANLFPNKAFNPVPGPAIRQERILKCLVKTNPSINATMISLASPVVVLYRAKGMSIEDFINGDGGIIPIPGATNGAKALACPADWVIDAVEVFDGSSSSNQKRLSDIFDAGYATLSSTFNSLSLARMKDEQASEAEGFEILVDTNNSSADFVELEKQSLRE
ncbi:MAG: DUF4876 domain-containing protein [Candidatus Cryptobacteroides sp.]